MKKVEAFIKVSKQLVRTANPPTPLPGVLRWEQGIGLGSFAVTLTLKQARIKDLAISDVRPEVEMLWCSNAWALEPACRSVEGTRKMH